MKTIATIDIGTHSILLLIVAIDAKGNIHPLEDCCELPRLGEGLNQTERISDAALERAKIVLRHYDTLCKKHQAQHIRIVATEALRRAKNGNEIVRAIKKEIGFDIEIISGPREASLTFAAASHDFGNDITVIDIGGGSTELIRLMHPGDFASGLTMVSMPIGSVVLTERFLHTDPVQDEEVQKLSEHIVATLTAHTGKSRPSGTTKLIATAGTATTIAAMALALETYDQGAVHGKTLSRNEIEQMIATLRSRTIEERKHLPGLHPKRADVIFAGTVLLNEAMKHFAFDAVTVSDRGVRWGLVYEAMS